MTWDLSELLMEREMPKRDVVLYLNEAASYAKVQLEKARAKATPEEVEAIDASLSEVEERLEASKYVVHLTGIPSRHRENLYDKALKKYPVKRDVLDRDEPENVRLRTRYNNQLLWEAQIESITNPRGEESGSWDIARIMEFEKVLPVKAQQAIDAGILALNTEAEEYTVGAQGVDFG